jgi:hypothetical protein
MTNSTEVDTTVVRPLHCRTDEGDVVLQLNARDAKGWGTAVEVDSRASGKHAPPNIWTPVTDQATGRRWRVAPASCGADCRCAAAAVSLEV